MACPRGPRAEGFRCHLVRESCWVPIEAFSSGAPSENGANRGQHFSSGSRRVPVERFVLDNENRHYVSCLSPLRQTRPNVRIWVATFDKTHVPYLRFCEGR